MVYVNELARGPMFSNDHATFPAGSIIVRERLAGSEAAGPDMLAVMIKRPRGFNRKSNDWDFLVVSGDGKKIDKRVKSGECVKCHESRSQDDFVFRQP